MQNIRNLQKGFIVPVLIAVITILAVVGGVYIYQNTKTESTVSTDAGTQNINTQTQSNNTQTNSTNNGSTNVPPATPANSNTQNSPLKTYKNDGYGFEFKYSSKWQECNAETLQNVRIKDSNAKLAICISDPSTKDDFHKILTFYVDQSGKYTFASLRQYLQNESKKATDLGLYPYFEEKKIGGRQYLHSGAGDVGTWGTYYTLLDAKTEQKTFLVIKYSNAIPELETILSSPLKMKEDGLSF